MIIIIIIGTEIKTRTEIEKKKGTGIKMVTGTRTRENGDPIAKEIAK